LQVPAAGEKKSLQTLEFKYQEQNLRGLTAEGLVLRESEKKK
jgi:hypothetical protein